MVNYDWINIQGKRKDRGPSSNSSSSIYHEHALSDLIVFNLITPCLGPSHSNAALAFPLLFIPILSKLLVQVLTIIPILLSLIRVSSGTGFPSS